MLLTGIQIDIFGNYVVEAYVQLPGEMIPAWHEVMNFGERQGEAMEARRDFEKMDTTRLYGLINKYNGKRMHRVKAGQYSPQK